MPELLELIHEISVAFAKSCNLRTLTPRLSTGMSLYSSLIEAEAIYLDRDRRTAKIIAHDPRTGRTWWGERSARFLHRQIGGDAHWSSETEPARASSAPVFSQLKLPVGRAGLLTLSFETEISVQWGSKHTEILVDCLRGHCARLGQLHNLSHGSLQAHRYISELEADTPDEVPATEKPVEQLPLLPSVLTEISVKPDVTTIEHALVGCISAALHATQGRIYGDSGAAKLLGIKPSTLQSKMRKLGIERGPFADQA